MINKCLCIVLINVFVINNNKWNMPLDSVVKCRLDADGTVCLKDILESFNSSIKEEHAWALCYQCAKCFSQVLNDNNIKCCYSVTDFEHVRLHSDGYVHQSTILLDSRHQTCK